MEPLIGTVFPSSTGFVPQGWLPCDGRLLSIAENQALFSILGTTYGGDGVQTFALPNISPLGADPENDPQAHLIIAVQGVYPTRP